MLEYVLYYVKYKTTCFGPAVAIIRFHQSKNALRWCCTICVTVCWWRDLVVSIPFCYIGCVGKSFGQYMKGNGV